MASEAKCGKRVQRFRKGADAGFTCVRHLGHDGQHSSWPLYDARHGYEPAEQPTGAPGPELGTWERDLLDKAAQSICEHCRQEGWPINTEDGRLFHTSDGSPCLAAAIYNMKEWAVRAESSRAVDADRRAAVHDAIWNYKWSDENRIVHTFGAGVCKGLEDSVVAALAAAPVEGHAKGAE